MFAQKSGGASPPLSTPLASLDPRTLPKATHSPAPSRVHRRGYTHSNPAHLHSGDPVELYYTLPWLYFGLLNSTTICLSATLIHWLNLLYFVPDYGYCVRYVWVPAERVAAVHACMYTLEDILPHHLKVSPTTNISQYSWLHTLGYVSILGCILLDTTVFLAGKGSILACILLDKTVFLAAYAWMSQYSWLHILG